MSGCDRVQRDIGAALVSPCRSLYLEYLRRGRRGIVERRCLDQIRVLETL